VNLTIPARQVTAICGPSGAGKSTLADLLLGLLQPSAGRILIDGEPLAGSRLHAWRQSIGYVPQETFLFHDTVRANLLWARPEATESEVRAALRAAAAAEFVSQLPDGLDTVTGDRGVRLSGGERQRLALARAILRQPSLLVLDEATSSLDTQNEQFIQQALERLHGELTIVIIAHRLSTVRVADQIIVLKGGRMVETGAWDDLCQREGGVFRELAFAGTVGLQ
jgi:ATP-binding cassette subfamily C protein